jgi:hypothetical protein
MSVMIVVWGLSPVGATLAGVVANWTDVRFALGLGASLAATVAASVLFRRPSLRSI